MNKDKHLIIRTKKIPNVVNVDISKNDNESIVEINNHIKNNINPIFYIYVNFYDLINKIINKNKPNIDINQPEMELYVDYEHYPIFKYKQRCLKSGKREAFCLNKFNTCMLNFSNLGANEIKFYIFYKTESDSPERLSIKQIDLFRRFNSLISKFDLVSNYTIVDIEEYRFKRGYMN